MMTVADLRRALAELPAHARIYVRYLPPEAEEGDDDFEQALNPDAHTFSVSPIAYPAAVGCTGLTRPDEDAHHASAFLFFIHDDEEVK